MKEKKSNFDSIEDSPDFLITIQGIAEASSSLAVAEAKDKGVSVTYLEDGKIIEEDPKGNKTILENSDLKWKPVTVGQTTTI